MTKTHPGADATLTTLDDSELTNVKGGYRWCSRPHGKGGYARSGGGGGASSSSNADTFSTNQTNVNSNVVISFDPQIVA